MNKEKLIIHKTEIEKIYCKLYGKDRRFCWIIETQQVSNCLKLKFQIQMTKRNKMKTMISIKGPKVIHLFS